MRQPRTSKNVCLSCGQPHDKDGNSTGMYESFEMALTILGDKNFPKRCRRTAKQHALDYWNIRKRYHIGWPRMKLILLFLAGFMIGFWIGLFMFLTI